MNETAFLRIRHLAAKQMGVNEEKLTADMRLGADLGMDGDDAYEFLQAFWTEFGVDMTDFPYDEYFGPESGFIFFNFVYYLLFRRDKLRLKELTFRELVRAAEAKRWVSPEQK